MTRTSPRRRCCPPFVLALGLFTLATPGQAPAYDGFAGGPLVDLAGSAGGVGWSGPWAGVGTDPTQVSTTGLDYPGLLTTGGAAVTPAATGAYPMSQYERAFQNQPAGTFYVSFLLRQDSAAGGGYGGLRFGQYPSALYVGSPPGWYAYGLMTSHGLGSTSTKSLVVGEITLVVVKIAANASGPGTTFSLYLDPAIGSPEPGSSAAAYSLGLGLPTGLTIDNGTGFTTDEIRVGATWASVLPAGPSAWTDFGFAKPGWLGAPRLTGSGPLTGNSTNLLQLTRAYPAAVVVQGIGFTAIDVPLLGGVLVPDPLLVTFLATDGGGAATWQLSVPAGLPPGLELFCQQWIRDPMATFGWSASNAVRASLQ